jgi:hypothetical protein
MVRLRFLSALLGCLAVLAAALPTVAYAWMPSASFADSSHAAIGTLCTQHCPECQGMPCPPSAAGCVVACVGMMPSLITAAVTLAIPKGSSEIWPDRFATLHGLSPPPDPTPPRS